MPAFELPSDLTKLSLAQLEELKAAAQQDIQDLLAERDDDNPFTMDDAAELTELTAALNTISGALTEVTASSEEISNAQAAARDALAKAAAITPRATAPEGDDTAGGESAPDAGTGDTATPDVTVPDNAAELTGDLVTASARRKSEPILKKPTLNERLRTASLREAAEKQGLTIVDGPELIITASADVPGFVSGKPLADRFAVADAMRARARAMPTSNGQPSYAPVATIEARLDTVLNSQMGLPEVSEALKKLTNPSQLWSTRRDGSEGITTAGGGWCAPSQNRYEFFDMTCEDGAIDLPTTGIERGGINFPTSPSMADVFTGSLDVTTNPWLWTETDDIATVTGSPNKPCVRVPCPGFNNVRLECFGICLTAGNLTDNAYPEATQHQIKLLNTAHFHAKNQRTINWMLSYSMAAITGGAGGAGVVSPVFYMVELAAEDYRTRFGMCQDDVLEVVLPHWVLAAMRADLTKRQGGDVDMIGVADNTIADWFDLRKVRVQFVNDFQVRASGLPGFTTDGTGFNSWPTSIDFMIYAAGTFIRGTGMSLNLGVVRDSTLNAENDHTALWMEECQLVARVGPQSRRYRVNICADGTTGAADLTACTP